MRRKIIPILVSMLFIFTIFSVNVFAGSEDDPEILDEKDDEVLEHLDIISAWFYEKEEEPDYLFISLKLKEINTKIPMQFLTVHWYYNNIQYVTGMRIGYSIPWIEFIAGKAEGWWFWFQVDFEPITGEYDEEKGIITCKIPKNLIGNPEEGDILTKTKASTMQRFGFRGRLGFDTLWVIALYRLTSGEVPWDGAPLEYGRDYKINY
jgi:hypothetical protein